MRLFDFDLALEFTTESTDGMELFSLLIDDLDECLSVEDQTYCKKSMLEYDMSLTIFERLL